MKSQQSLDYLIRKLSNVLEFIYNLHKLNLFKKEIMFQNLNINPIHLHNLLRKFALGFLNEMLD